MSDEYITEYFDCLCYSNEHGLRFSLTEYGEDDVELDTSVYLNQYHGFFGRVWQALKYVFGYRCKNGHFDTFLLNPKDVDRLMGMLEKYKKIRQSFGQSQKSE